MGERKISFLITVKDKKNMNTKKLISLEKRYHKTQTKDKCSFVFNGVYYPSEFPRARVYTDGRDLMIDNQGCLVSGNRDLLGSGKINHWDVELTGGTKEIEGNFPDFLRVIPKEIENLYEIEIPEWFEQIKKPTFLFLSLNSGSFSSLPTSENDIYLSVDRLNWLAGETVSLGVNGSDSAIAIWEKETGYNPTVNDWTFILMPGKKSNEVKPTIKKIEYVCEGIEQVA
jgi:hypothetical protein